MEQKGMLRMGMDNGAVWMDTPASSILSGMKSVGIIGGLGPETSAEFYLEVVFRCQKLNTTQRPLILMSSVPLLFEIERDLIESNTGKERYIPFLVREAQRLERAGVDFIVLPCNSLHVFIDELRKAVSVPVLSIVEETVSVLNKDDIDKVGLISTSATIENRVYENSFEKAGIDFVIPNNLQRAKMDKIIQNLISGRHMNSDREYIQEVIDDLATQGVKSVALACTDLQILIPGNDRIPVFDTMSVLAEATVREILG